MAFFVLVVGMAPPADAQTVVPVTSPMSETVTIPANASRAYVAALAASDAFRFSVRVTQGSLVDVFLLDSTGYANYTSPSTRTFDYFVSGTEQNTASVTASFPAPRAGDYYLVVDNAPATAGGAPGDAPVTVTVTAEIARSSILLVVLVVGVIAIAAAAVVFLVRSRRKTRAAEGPSEEARSPPPNK